MMITGTGCALMDYLYNHVDFSSEAFRRSCSRSPGDGGLSPGGLVFADELQQFTGKSSAELLQKIVGDRPPDGENLGGPAVVALVHAAQLLRPSNIPVAFHGARGNDGGGRKMLEILRSTPLRVNDLIIKDGPTPSTVVLSDPTYREGRGERTFINTVGAADNYTADDLDDSFFKGNINLFGGTALLPGLHDSLLPVLRKSKRHESITVVATVYDFRNEKKAPNRPWPLGESTETYSSVDLLIVDQEEAIRLSGQASPEQAAAQFTDWGVGALIITQGADAILVQSQGKLFAPLPPTWLEVCKAADRDLEIQPEKRGDTTGCGDNFVGGTIAALAARLKRGQTPDLPTACAWGAASGGLACFHLGGTYIEQRPGEKLEAVRKYVDAYAAQVKNKVSIETNDI